MQIHVSIPPSLQPITEVTQTFPAKPVSQNDLIEVKAKPADAPKPEKTDDKSNPDAEKLQKIFDDHQMTLKFSRDAKTQALVVQLIDQKTGESVLQMPSEISLKLAAEIGKMQGLFVNQKA